MGRPVIGGRDPVQIVLDEDVKELQWSRPVISRASLQLGDEGVHLIGAAMEPAGYRPGDGASTRRGGDQGTPCDGVGRVGAFLEDNTLRGIMALQWSRPVIGRASRAAGRA